MSDDLSAKMRTYLAEVYRLTDREQPEDGYVSTSSLAEMLSVSAPAVNRMVNRLKEQALLEHEPYRGIHLTRQGEVEALKKLRSHRIAEAFLVSVMGFDWTEIYQEAEQISSATSEVLIKRMALMAGNPAYCPHGEPIPDADGQIEAMDDQLLSDVEPNTEVVVTRMLTREAERLNYISALGLLPGLQLTVLHKAPFNGPMQLRVKEEYRIIGHNLAELIRVRPI